MEYFDVVWLILNWLWDNPITNFMIIILMLIILSLIFWIIAEYSSTYLLFLRANPEEFDNYYTYMTQGDDGAGFRPKGKL